LRAVRGADGFAGLASHAVIPAMEVTVANAVVTEPRRADRLAHGTSEPRRAPLRGPP
jgi:hypothetical protein